MPASIANPLYFLPGSSTVTPADNQVRFSDVIDFFFVAHPVSGRKEGEEHKRIMYFSPKHEPLNRQTDVTGFAEAVVNFTDNFVDRRDAPCLEEFPFRTVTTKKTEQVYIQVENMEFLIGVSLVKSHCEALDYPIYPPAIRTILGDAYKMFRLFFGCFSPFMRNNEEKFKERLEYFFSRFLPLLKLNTMPLLDLLQGAAFLPLSSSLYLNTVTLTDELIEEFPIIEKILVLYQDKLLYYTVASRDLPSLFRYLTQNLLPMSIGPELEPTRTSTHGRFLRGPSDLSTDQPLLGDDALPTVHLYTASKDDEDEYVLSTYQLMVYRSLNATMCLFVKGDVTRRLMRNIDGFLGSELSKLASEIGESIGHQSYDLRATSDFHFVYFNPSSLSMTSSFEAYSAGTSSGPRLPAPPLDVNRLVCETMSSFMNNDDEFGECFVKSDSEWWIVLKKVNSRLLCLLLPPSSSQQSLADVQARSQGIIKSHFEAIFFN